MSRPNVLMFAYAVDSQDVGEAKLTYEWIEHISQHVNITLITMGSRINEQCGLENNAYVDLYFVKPLLTFRWSGAFDRVIKPDYFEIFKKARKLAKTLVTEKNFQALHHIAPHSPRYPSPLHGLHANFLIGPIHGGLSVPKAFVKPNIKTKLADSLRRLDSFRYEKDPLMQKHFGFARKLLISAPYVQNLLPEKFSEKCQVIPPQPPSNIEVSFSEEKSCAVKKPIKLMFVGRLIDSKGIRYTIEALKDIPQCDFQFNIYGSGELEAEMRELVKAYKLSNVVSFKGFTEHKIVLKEMENHDVFVFPSLKEAWGLVATEAISAGLAVVCMNIGGPAHIVNEQCGIRLEAETPKELVSKLRKALIHLIDNPEKIAEYKRQAKARAKEKFTWQALTQALLIQYSY